ncbi:MAG: hypothetical protein ACUVWR_13540 [Anaerolineae bacterium]
MSDLPPRRTETFIPRLWSEYLKQTPLRLRVAACGHLCRFRGLV